MHEADGNVVRAHVDQAAGLRDHVVARNRHDDLAVLTDPLGHLGHPAARHQRHGTRGIQVVRLRQAQPPQFQDVPEPLRHEQADLGPVALQQRVHPQRRPVREIGDLLGTDAMLVAQRGQPGDDRLFRVLAVRRHLERGQRPVAFVEQEHVGKRPPDIHPKAVPLSRLSHHSGKPPSVAAAPPISSAPRAICSIYRYSFLEYDIVAVLNREILRLCPTAAAIVPKFRATALTCGARPRFILPQISRGRRRRGAAPLLHLPANPAPGRKAAPPAPPECTLPVPGPRL